jgi:hypothetical protein
MLLKKFQVALLLVALLVAVGAFAQSSTTGAIQGTVTQGGTPLPGVTIEVRSSNLQGARTDTTNARGEFNLSQLPVGDYSLTATLSGFNTVKQNNVHVGIGRIVTLEVALSPQATAEITVTGAAPVVDVTTAQSGANITAQTMQTLPMGRNFVAAAQVAPGTSNDAVGTTVYGSSGAENSYVIDGLNTTGVERGLQGKRLNFDFVQEVEVITGGLPAEYGRMTGGVINAITKSGSNEFHGDLFGYDSGGSFNANPNIASKAPATTTTIGSVDKQYDFGANLGGYIMKDRLWFFGAYDKVKEDDLSKRVNTPLIIPPPANYAVAIGQTLPSSLDRDLYAGKLSLALTSSHLLNLSVFGDPSKVNGAIRAIQGVPSTFEGINKIGGTDGILRYSGVFGTQWNANASFGKHREENTTTGAGTSISQVQYRTSVPNIFLGGLGFVQNQKFSRDTGKVDLSAFFGSHQFKFGGDRENQKAVNSNAFSGGDRVRVQCSVSIPLTLDANGYRNCPTGEPFYYIHEVYVNSTSVNPKDPSTFAANVLQALTSSPKTQNTSAYLQDSWKMMPNLTLNAGVRWESQKVGGLPTATLNGAPAPKWPINLKNNLAPRLGLIWDVANNGRSKLYANYGRFYESIPMDINLRTFGGELSLQVNNADPTPLHLQPGCPAGQTTACAILANGRSVPAAAGSGANRTWAKFLGNPESTPVDPNLKGQYIDEMLLGYDYELAANLAVGIKGTYRNLGRVIEDMSAGGQYKVANPGSGEGVTTGYLYQDGVAVVPKPKRQYKGVELHATKRFSNNYQFFTSYVWSRLQGNYDGTFQASTGQLDPNINSAYDYGEFAVNNNGLLSNDRTHQFKFYGSYTLPSGFAKGLDLGLSTYWASGFPLTAFGYDTLYRNYEAYLTPRGALGRGPSQYEADLHFGFPVNFGGGSRLNLLLDVFNVFNRQSITNLDQRYNLSSDPACAGLGALGNCVPGVGGGEIQNLPGTVTPVGQLANPRATATNPDFLKKGVGFTGVRSVRLGARWSF